MANKNDAKNVLSGKPKVGGAIFRAPLGTERPTDAKTPLNEAYKNLGYASDEGVTETVERSTEKIKAWGGDTVKIVQTEYGVEYSFQLIETLNDEVLKTLYGDGNVETTPATESTGTLRKVLLNSKSLPAAQYVFDLVDADAVIRIDLIGQVSEVGDITYSDEDVIKYEVTVSAVADSDGNSAIKHIDDGIAVASS